MLLLLSLIAADPAATVRVTDVRMDLTGVGQAETPRRSPYRLDPNVAGPADGKDAAVGMTGSKCAVTGARMCTRKPRTIYAASY